MPVQIGFLCDQYGAELHGFSLHRIEQPLHVGALILLPLTASCVTVRPPDKPIEINLNVKIEQEVLVRLQRDVDQLIRENPDTFPAIP